MLSEKEEEYNAKMDRIADEYMEKAMEQASWSDAENLSFVFTYKKTVNLVKYSENLLKSSEILNKWTKILAGTAVAMIIIAVVQIFTS